MSDVALNVTSCCRIIIQSVYLHFWTLFCQLLSISIMHLNCVCELNHQTINKILTHHQKDTKDKHNTVIKFKNISVVPSPLHWAIFGALQWDLWFYKYNKRVGDDAYDQAHRSSSDLMKWAYIVIIIRKALVTQCLVICCFLSNSLVQLGCILWKYYAFTFFSISRFQMHHLLQTAAVVVQQNCLSIVRCGVRDRETFGGENTALNKVLFLICLSLQETLRALCCKVSASCLPLFLSHSFSSPFLSPLFPPPAVWVIEFIPLGRRTTSGPPPSDTRHVASSAPMLHLWQLWVTMLFLNPR